MCLGAILGPYEAALCVRGLRTLELWVRRSDASARQVATYLAEHPKVEQVLHPLLPGFPGRELAGRQMSGSGGLFSVYFKAEDSTGRTISCLNTEHTEKHGDTYPLRRDVGVFMECNGFQNSVHLCDALCLNPIGI